MNTLLVVSIWIIGLIWYLFAISIAAEMGKAGMDLTLVALLLALLPVVHVVIWACLRRKRTRKEGEKFFKFDWIGSFSDTFKSIRNSHE